MVTPERESGKADQRSVDEAVDLLRDTFAKKLLLVDSKAVSATDSGSPSLDQLPRQAFSWFAWNEPVGLYCESVGHVTTLFPFYNSLVVPLHPHRSRDEFVQVLGLTPEALAELSLQGFVNILYVGGLEDYRKAFYLPILRCGNVGHIYQLAALVAQATGTDIPKLQDDIGNLILRRFDSEGCMLPPNLLTDFRTRAIELALVGYRDLVEEILHQDRKADQSILDLLVFHQLLAEPWFRGSDAIRNVGADFWNTLASHLPKGIGGIQPSDVDIIVPRDLLLSFARQFDFVDPASMRDPVGYRERLAKSESVVENQRILRKLSDLVAERRYQDTPEVITDLENHVTRHLNREIEKIEKWDKLRRHTLSIGLAFTGTKLAQLGAQALKGDDPFFTDIVTVGSLALQRLIGTSAGKLSRVMAGSFLGRDSLPFLLWKRKIDSG